MASAARWCAWKGPAPEDRARLPEHNNLLAAGEFVSKPEFQDFNIIEIPEEESYAANCIWVNEG